MNILKKFRNPNLSLLLVLLILFASCNQEDLSASEDLSFNYKTFESYKSESFKVQIPENINNLENNSEKYSKIINIINTELGSNLYITELDEKYLTESVSKQNVEFISKEYLNETDIKLINSLKKDFNKVDFDTAIKRFENSVLKLNLSETEIGKYNAFANVLKLLNNQDEKIFSSINSKNLSAKELSNCGDATLSYTLATLGLAACGATGPAAPLFCGIAIANKVRTFRNMIKACK